MKDDVSLHEQGYHRHVQAGSQRHQRANETHIAQAVFPIIDSPLRYPDRGRERHLRQSEVRAACTDGFAERDEKGIWNGHPARTILFAGPFDNVRIDVAGCPIIGNGLGT